MLRKPTYPRVLTRRLSPARLLATMLWGMVGQRDHNGLVPPLPEDPKTCADIFCHRTAV